MRGRGTWRGLRRAAMAAAAALSLVATLATTGVVAATAQGMARYGTRGLWVTDASGRVLLLRGADVSGDEYTPTDRPLPYGPSDFAAVRATGATVVRIPISWANVEPAPGHFDKAAIQRVVDIVGWAGAAGLEVVLDMHQWEWSPCFGGNGMPAWATDPCPDVSGTLTATPLSSVPGAGLVSGEGAVTTETAPAETAFWESSALQEQFARAWEAVAEAVGHPAYLLGFDILNEPPNGLVPPAVFESVVLPRFYRQVGSALRAVDPGALLFVEPALVHSAVTAASTLPVPVGLPRVVYAPHEYGTSLNDAAGDVADVAGPDQFAPDLAVTVAQAQEMGAALWIGEWGAVNPASSLSYDSAAYVPDMVAAMDRAMVGSAYWSYTSTAAQGWWPAADLTRMTPYAVAGVPLSLSTGGHTMTLEWRATAGTTLVSLPAGVDPTVRVLKGTVTATSVLPTEDALTGSVDGGWLEVSAPAGTTVSIVVTA